MNTRLFPWLIALLVFAAGMWPARAGACTTRQVITLQPGWNAIHVGVDPDEKDIATVFAGIEAASVWRYRPDQGGPQFVRDPADGLENLEGWFGWFPASRPEAFLTNLFQLEPNTAYLIRLEGTQSRTITLTGRPIYVAPDWQADAFTLTGLPITPANAPSFGEYFGPSPAHVAQPVYSLGTDGRWSLVSAATEPVKADRAYWIYTKGNSRYHSPLQVLLAQGDSLEFGDALESSRVVLRNLTGLNGSFTLRREGGNTLPLSYRVDDPATGNTTFPALGETLVLPSSAGTDVFLTLAPRRAEFSAARQAQVFTVSDEQGSCVLFQAAADAAQPAALPGGPGVPGGGTGAVSSYAGLWAGDVEIDAVSQAQMRGTNVPGSTPLPTQRTFSFRVLMHVDAAGNVKLLKDVIQMWKEGTTRPSSVDPTLSEVATPGRYVLLTDPQLTGQFSGAAMRGDTPVGQRFSTVSYDFDGRTLAMTGQLGPGQDLQATIVVGANLPTNPFLHRFHPDHDNLDAQFAAPRAEAYEVRRVQVFSIAAQEPGGGSSPGWNSSELAGTFRETVTGLHRAPIVASGSVRLQRVSPIAVLNQ